MPYMPVYAALEKIQVPTVRLPAIDPIHRPMPGGRIGLYELAQRSGAEPNIQDRSEEHTSELQSHHEIVCSLLLEKKKKKIVITELEYHNKKHKEHRMKKKQQ